MVGSSQVTSKKNLIKFFSSDINTLRCPVLFSRKFYFNSFRCFYAHYRTGRSQQIICRSTASATHTHTLLFAIHCGDFRVSLAAQIDSFPTKCDRHRSVTLSPIIMEVKNGGLEDDFSLQVAIFHFHDVGG